MNSYRSGDIILNIGILIFIAGVAFVWHIAKNVKTLKQQRIFALVFLIVVSYVLAHLWLFTSPDTRGSEERVAFEFWRIMVTFICIVGGVPAVIALMAGYKEK